MLITCFKRQTSKERQTEMKKLLTFEMKKIWFRKGRYLPILLILAVLISLTVMHIDLKAVLNGENRAINEETRAYWGQPITEELMSVAQEKLKAYGAEIYHDEYGVSVDIGPIVDQYGWDSREFNRAYVWYNIAQGPSLDEEMQSLQETLRSDAERVKDQPQKLELAERRAARKSSPAVWYVAPSVSVWQYCIQTGGYTWVFLGLIILLSLIVMLSNVFGMEESGSLWEISLSAFNRRRWIGSKVLASALSGGAIAAFFTLGVFLIFGVLFGFHGWNIGVLSSTGYGGYAYGMLYRDIKCWQAALILLGMRVLSGMFLGVLVAACSAVFKNAVAAAGAFAVLLACMEYPMYALGRYCQDPSHFAKLETMDMDRIWALAFTPVRHFLNPELYSARMEGLVSAYDELNVLNTLITPDLLLIHLALIAAGLALCIGLCFTYQSRR